MIMFLLLFFAFLSGLVTILTPCIWPILPIILSSSIANKGHQRPLGITIGIMVSFSIFTLAISSLVRLFHFDPNILRLGAVIIIGFLGLSMVIPALSRVTERFISRLTGLFGGTTQQKGKGFGPGFITGLSLGIVWSPCAGPILAAIATLAATGKVTSTVIFITIAYVGGVGIPLFLFAYAGQKLFAKTRFISQYTGRIQQVFGFLMLLTALAIYTNYDQYIQTKVLNAFPALSFSGLGNTQAIQNQLNALRGNPVSNTTSSDASQMLNANQPAPDFTGVTKWLNTDKPLSLKDLHGKVILVDFWTYTCINCIRTLPHVTTWYDTYKDQGFVVVGVHTPEFEFEKNTDNVYAAIRRFNIHYPVAQDNNYGTWNAYSNQYWPAEYLIDGKGVIRRTEFGEGEYDKTEMAIRELLKENGQKVNQKTTSMPDQTPRGQLSPETYVGSKRMMYYYPSGNTGNTESTFTLSNSLSDDTFSLGGKWLITDENAIAENNAVLNYNFSADKVFLVMRPGTAGKNAKVQISVDGKVVDSTNAGADVTNGVVTIDSDRLYNLIDLKGNTGRHILKLEYQTPGIEVFAFTFG